MIEDDLIGLAQSTHVDAADLFACCQDIDAQKGNSDRFDQKVGALRSR